MEDVASQLEAYVGRIAAMVAKIGPKDWKYGDATFTDPTHVICQALPLTDLNTEPRKVLGEKNVDEFYGKESPAGPPAELRTIMVLVNTIPCACTQAGQSFTLDVKTCLEYLKAFADCVASKTVNMEIILRLSGIDIDNDYELADGVKLRRITEREAHLRYSGGPGYVLPQFPVPPTPQTASLHRVEVVIQKVGSYSATGKLKGVDETEALINKIKHAFMLSGVVKNAPLVTHVRWNSELDRSSYWQGMGLTAQQPEHITPESLALVVRAYEFLGDAESDTILQAAVDRYFIGRKTWEHHPNRMNSPHWDKVVDYVIAMESLFLTANESSVMQESTYRFRVNGASLLHAATEIDRLTVFHALNHLYSLRSKVVHGNSGAVLKVAREFIKSLGGAIDDPSNGLVLLNTACKIIEEWLAKIFYHLAAMDEKQRPYRLKDGWELMLWPKSQLQSTEAAK
ncbi:HEPN domain-containing protein [Lacipirellula parvula]|uniref:Uncharacterized protein n=1 Tax=Lacipirellula parvula TaxID=2650471 RepID=A0A5K7XJW2_9BACT|nr:HEPN domain-containing protein [Lacipirellula parvula]BBO33179.1 hypothetical protein PLANPX_2791 [Lacipirellula parvula]